MTWLTAHWPDLLPVLPAGLAIRWLLPRPGGPPRLLGLVAGAVALVLVQQRFLPAGDDLVAAALFYVPAAAAVCAGALMITDRNPAYAALWFSVATLATCGLFLLNSAPFLAAAAVVIYAGAIIVTFLFVLMLAQQEGRTAIDRHSVQPGSATLLGCVLLGCLLIGVQRGAGASEKAAASQVREARGLQPPGFDGGESRPRFLTVPDAATANPLSRPAEGELGSLRGIGRSLFGDYLFAVELAGTLLLVAAIGAIALAPRRSTGAL